MVSYLLGGGYSAVWTCKQFFLSYKDAWMSEREVYCNDGWTFVERKTPHTDVLGNTEKKGALFDKPVRMWQFLCFVFVVVVTSLYIRNGLLCHMSVHTWRFAVSHVCAYVTVCCVICLYCIRDWLLCRMSVHTWLVVVSHVFTHVTVCRMTCLYRPVHTWQFTVWQICTCVTICCVTCLYIRDGLLCDMSVHTWQIALWHDDLLCDISVHAWRFAVCL